MVPVEKQKSVESTHKLVATYNWWINETNIIFCIYLVFHSKPLYHKKHRLCTSVTNSLVNEIVGFLFKIGFKNIKMEMEDFDFEQNITSFIPTKSSFFKTLKDKNNHGKKSVTTF